MAAGNVILREEHVFEKINKYIDPKDTMFHGTEKKYFEIGASALNVTRSALAAAQIPESEIRNILDYGCGYGRVLRWFSGAFEHAKILGMDRDGAALASIEANLSVETRLVDLELKHDLNSSFELIWMGSLFSHLPEVELLRLLKYLSRHLSKNGLLVFTTLGPFAEGRIRSGKKLYGLGSEEAGRLLLDYRNSGFGFGNYPKQVNYGIALVHPFWIMGKFDEHGLNPVFFAQKGWDHHQDVFAANLCY